MKSKYSTPQLFANDVVREGSPAYTHMYQQAMLFKPMAKGFGTGKDLWNAKTIVDITLYDFHKKYDAAPTWNQESVDDSLVVISKMANYFANYMKSESVVQMASRIMPDDVRQKIDKEIERREKQGGQASSSKKPMKSGFGILAALAAVGVFLLMRKKQG